VVVVFFIWGSYLICRMIISAFFEGEKAGE